MKVHLFIAGRYLFSKKKRNAINIISGIAVLAFTVCTAALIIVLSTMNGFENLIFSMYSRFNPDIKITPTHGKVFEPQGVQAKLKNMQGVKQIWPVLEEHAVIRNGDYQSVCTVKGVDINYFNGNGLSSYLTAGEALLRENSINYMILGAGVKQRVNAGIDVPYSKVSLVSPRRGDYNVNDADAIREMLIEPGGVVTLDEEISNKYVYVPLDFAEQLFERTGKVSSLEIRLNNIEEMSEMKKKLQTTLGDDFKIEDRYEQQSSLYKMFKSEKWASYAILTFILLIAAFNVLGSLTMLVMEKKDDIRTLKGMGASNSTIRKVFFTNGFLISGIGAFTGLVIGIVLVVLQEHYGLIKMQGAIVENYPVKLMGFDVLVISLTVMLLGFMTGIYPASKAAKQ